jgi:hypothetical protein
MAKPKQPKNQIGKERAENSRDDLGFPSQLGLVGNARLEETSARIGMHVANPGSRTRECDGLRRNSR